MLSMNQGCICAFIIFSLLSLAVPGGPTQSALSYFWGTVAYSFLIEMFGYIFFTWMEIVYYASHPSWSQSRLRTYKYCFLVWVWVVCAVLAFTSVGLQVENSAWMDNFVAGELPEVVTFEFHALILSVGFAVCLYQLCKADRQYSRFTDLFRRLTKLNFAFLGCLISLVLCILMIIIGNNDEQIVTITTALFIIFFLIPPLVIPPIVMWFFNPYTKLLNDPEEDISGGGSSPNDPSNAKNDARNKSISDTTDNSAISPSSAALESGEQPVLVKHDSLQNLNPNALPINIV